MNPRWLKIKCHRPALPLLAMVVFFCVIRPLTTSAAPADKPLSESESERNQNIALSNLLQSGYLSATNPRPAQPVVPKAAGVKTTNTFTAPATPVVTATNSTAGDVDTNQVNVLDNKYHLAIGDQVSFQILEDGDPPKLLTVTDSGDLQVPYIGLYPAVGKTCKQLAAALKVQLEKEYYKQATVIIAVTAKPRSRGRVYLVGAVRSPGPQDISSDEQLTVSKAILRAGGFTDFANEKEVHITRELVPGEDDKTNIVVNVAQIFEQGKIENDVPLRPGDLIYVPERLVRF